jgi:hypothetical protein
MEERPVDALIEDGLTRMAIMLEVSSQYGLGVAQDYEGLLAAAVARRGLKDELAAGVEETQQALLDEAIARAGPGASSGYFTTGVEDTGASKIGAALDALLAVGAISAEDVQSFLRERIRRVAAYRDLTGAISDDPAPFAHFDEVWPDRAADPDTTPRIGEVHVAGRPLETLLGPADRRCGVRVLAVECCEDAGTVYRGEISPDRPVEILQDDGIDEIAAYVFTPAAPRGAVALWLASHDASVRITLR